MEDDKVEKRHVNLGQYLPQLSLRERNRRWAAVWEEMGLHDLRCLLLIGNDRFYGYASANVRYLTQVSGQRIGTAVIFPLEGIPSVFAAAPHFHDKPFPMYKAYNNWIDETRAYTGLGPVVETLQEMGLEKANIGLVGFKGAFRGSTISYQEYQYLVKELPHATFSDATPLLEKVRMIKSPEEVQLLKKSGEIARLKIDTLVKLAAPGLRECELYAEMVKTDISHGGEAFVMNLFTSGSVTEEGTLQHLLHGKAQPLGPTTRPLGKGDLILSEFHTSYGGYLTGCETSVFIGNPPKELRRIHEVAVECQERGIEKLRPGISIGEALQAFLEPARKAGMGYLELGFHGHGLSSPEFPTLIHTSAGSQGKAGSSASSTGTVVYGLSSVEIKENMVFATNIDLHDPNWRHDVGIMGPVDTLWVTKNGPVKMINTPLEFHTVQA
jgi:Xaa-Pro aminopeptidase